MEVNHYAVVTYNFHSNGFILLPSSTRVGRGKVSSANRLAFYLVKCQINLNKKNVENTSYIFRTDLLVLISSLLLFSD